MSVNISGCAYLENISPKTGNFMKSVLGTHKGRIQVTERAFSSCYSLFVDTSNDSCPYWCRERSASHAAEGTLCGNDEEITNGGYIRISTSADFI